MGHHTKFRRAHLNSFFTSNRRSSISFVSSSNCAFCASSSATLAASKSNFSCDKRDRCVVAQSSGTPSARCLPAQASAAVASASRVLTSRPVPFDVLRCQSDTVSRLRGPPVRQRGGSMRIPQHCSQQMTSATLIFFSKTARSFCNSSTVLCNAWNSSGSTCSFRLG